MPTVKTQHPGSRVIVGYPNNRGDYESQMDILAHGLADENGDFVFDLDPRKVQPQDATVRIRIPMQETKPLEYTLEPFTNDIKPVATETVDEVVEAEDEPDDRNTEPDSEGVLPDEPED